MANSVLFVSSLFLTFVHYWALMEVYPKVSPFYSFIILRGCLTSIYNHGYTDSFLKFYDRMVMHESAIVDIYFMIKTNSLAFAGPNILLAIWFYSISKFTSNIFYRNLIHLLAHFSVTTAHIKIIIEIAERANQ